MNAHTHDVEIEHGEKADFVQIEMTGEPSLSCVLCASTAEDRARITFVKAEAVPA